MLFVCSQINIVIISIFLRRHNDVKVTSPSCNSVHVFCTTFDYSTVAMVTDLRRHLTSSYVSYVFDVITGPKTSVDAFRYSGLILVLSPEV